MIDAQEFRLQTLSEVEDSRYVIFSPGVGYYVDWPRKGALLTGGSYIGRMKTLDTYYDLHLPADVFGRVAVDEDRDFVLPVAYGEELFRLNPDKGIDESEQKKATVESVPGEIGTTGDGFIVTAFTTGIFYAKPSPDSPPFVTEGQLVEKGKALGLIEVMKTFNHIIFHGTDKSASGRIKKIFIKDSQEVKLGQPLFLIE
jgi:acetyl-CoA carboxylase biotin carboxyl carrier protein